MVTPLPVSLDQFKDHLNLTTATAETDVELTLHLSAATIATEGRVGPIMNRSYDTQASASGGVILLERRPVVELTSVTNPAGTEVDVARLYVDRTAGIVYTTSGTALCGPYDVVYVAGRAETLADVDESLQLAVLIVGAHLWETQRGTQGRGTLLGDDFDAGGFTTPDVRLMLRGFALPRRALELMQPYEPGVVIA